LDNADFKKLELAPAYRKVAESIGQMIATGRLRPGDWLPIETELAGQLGVNRSTIREGLRSLEHEGLVRRDGKRLKVAIPHYGDLASRASRALVMHEVTFRELWEASSAIETVTAVLAASRISANTLTALKNNVAEMASRLNDTDSVIALDIEFHDLLAEAAQNRALSLAREPISLLFYPAGKVILSQLKTEKRILEAHKEILDALKRRNVVEVRASMERHMADFKRGFERTGSSMESALDTELIRVVTPKADLRTAARQIP
jgi:GntR family transcriptional regulator, transcriptional repressor for pyruvate dehydrogenase complex